MAISLREQRKEAGAGALARSICLGLALAIFCPRASAGEPPATPGVEPSFRAGSVELCASVAGYVSRSDSGFSSAPPRLSAGVYLLPHTEVEVAARLWRYGAGDGVYTGRLCLYHRTIIRAKREITPYLFAGFGFGVSGPIDDDAYEANIVGAGLKVFVRETVALQMEYGAAYYSKAWGWFSSSSSDQTLSLGFSLFLVR